MIISVGLGIISVYLVYYLITKIPKVENNVALYPNSYPIFGHLLHIMRVQDIYSVFLNIGKHCHENGGISALFFGPYPMYVIANPEDATIVLEKCLEKMFLYKFIEPLYGDTLVAATGSVWSRNRRILDLAFKQNILDSYLKVFNDQAFLLVNNLALKVNNGMLDLTDDVTRNVLETTCLTTMGMAIDGKDFADDKYVEAAKDVFKITTLRVKLPYYLPDFIFNKSALKKKFDKSLKIITRVSEKMVQLRKSEHLRRMKNKEDENEIQEFQSYLKILMENTMTQEAALFTDKQYRYLCDNILLAAFFTTTNEMIFTLVCLGSDQEFQKKIYDEIIEVMGSEDELKKDDLPKLIHIEAAIKESLRLYPIGPVIGRETTAEVQLSKGKIKIPPKTPIAVHLQAINRNKKYWGDDADEYKPERWLNKDTLPERSNAFASFSFGKRNCIGKTYAMMYMKATLAAVVRRYRIKADHDNMKLDCYIMLKAKDGHFISLEHR